jgi:hypothetical protein
VTDPPRPKRWLEGLLIVEALAFWLANLPTWLDFPGFAFGDLGASITTQDLVSRGYRPGVDFAHHYGLLPIALGRLWFGMIGPSPPAFYLAMGLIEAWMAWSLARVAQARRVGLTGSTLLAVGLPFFVQSCYPNLAHGLEAGLLCHALAEQARGRNGVALAMATLAVLAKPSLGLAYGFVLVLVILFSLRGRWSWRAAVRFDALGPSLVTGLVMVALLAMTYGVESVVRTVLPMAGMATYRAGGFGFFFGSGRDFWRPAGAGPGYYLGTVAGFWLAGSLTLTAVGLVALARRLRSPENDSFLVTCAAVHALFVCELFGHSNTWVYDSYVLGAGLAVVPSMGRGWRRWTWILIGVAAIGWMTPLTAPLTHWRSQVRSPETAGLWSDPRDRAEWIEVRSKLKGQDQVAVLTTSGCSERLYTDLTPAEGVFFVDGLENEPDVARKARVIAASNWVIVPKYLGNARLTRWPVFATALGRFEVVHEGSFYRIYRRGTN